MRTVDHRSKTQVTAGVSPSGYRMAIKKMDVPYQVSVGSPGSDLKKDDQRHQQQGCEDQQASQQARSGYGRRYL